MAWVTFSSWFSRVCKAELFVCLRKQSHWESWHCPSWTNCVGILPSHPTHRRQRNALFSSRMHLRNSSKPYWNDKCPDQPAYGNPDPATQWHLVENRFTSLWKASFVNSLNKEEDFTRRQALSHGLEGVSSNGKALTMTWTHHWKLANVVLKQLSEQHLLIE